MKRIFFVEDDSGLINGLSFAMKRQGYEVTLARTCLEAQATDADVEAIRALIGNQGTVKDKWDQRTAGTYWAFVFCVYCFLFIITLVTVLNIINSISMSVSARIKQYGAMRAVGMEARQMTRMIAAEAFTYAICGCVAGRHWFVCK